MKIIEDQKIHNLRIGTLNTNNIFENIGYVNEASFRTSILFVNETKAMNQLNIDEVIYLNDKKLFSKNATRKGKKGNCSGGLAFIVDSNLKARVKFLSNRVGQLRLNNLCLIGVYLTYDDNTPRSLIDLEAELELVFQTVRNRTNEGYECIILGDFNVDMYKHPERSNMLSNYLNTYKFELVDQQLELAFDYTYQMIRKKKNSEEIEIIRSFIDHVAAPIECKNISFIEVYDELGNNSDHNLLLLNYNMQTNATMENMYTKPKSIKRIFDWSDTEFIKNYRERLNKSLTTSKFTQLLSKLKVSKTKKESKLLIDDTHKEFQRIIMDCATKAYNELNLTKRSSRSHRRRKTNFWWTDDLKNTYEQKKSAYREYKESGFDETYKTKFIECKKLFKMQKKYNIQLKRDKNLQLINEMFKMNKKNFWRKVKKLSQTSTQIDAKIEDINEEYSKLFNNKNESHTSIANECKAKLDKIIETLKTDDPNTLPISDLELKLIIREKIKALNNNKAIGMSQISNEMIKYALQPSATIENEVINDPFLETLNTLFSSMICSQHVPKFFNMSIIKPLIKDLNKDTDSINNLRGIAVSDTLQNLYESILEEMIKNEVKTDKKQFGFKSNHSCSHAILILKQTMNAAKKLGHRLYISAIDAAKAFDKVNRDILWCKMIDIGVSPILVLSVMSYYEKSMMLVQLEDELSKPFFTNVGVRQGGVLSPLLFSIYINDILIELGKMKLGYKIGEMMIDVLAYADDLLLLTRNKIDMQLMLAKLSTLGNNYEIKFNSDKSMYIIFNRFHERSKIDQLYDEWDGELLLAGKPIAKVESFRYLGAMITDTNSNNEHIKKRRSGVLASIAKIISVGLSSQIANPILRAEMFKTHIRPIVMYALENFNLNIGEIKKIKSAEGNALKRLIGISTRCKSTDLFLSFNLMPTNERIKWLKLKHYIRMQSNEYTKSFLSTIEKLEIENSLIDELNKITSYIPDLKEFSLLDKCLIAVKDLEDLNEEKTLTSKTCQLLKMTYNLSNREDMKQIILKLIGF